MAPQTEPVNTAAALRPHLFHRLRQATAGYPRSFWILFWGMLIQNVGTSMVWPFLTIYIRQRLGIPLTTVTLLIMIPTSTALTANLAPPDMRGRYMGVYSLTWGVGFGLGPVVGGLLNDHVAPVAMWYGGMALGLAAAVGFVALGRWLKVQGDSSLRSE